jgi:hypothetical protein
MTLYNAQPLIYLDENIQDTYGCIIHRKLWSEWSLEIADLMLVKITHNDEVYHLHVDSFHDDDEGKIFLPQWCFTLGIYMDVKMERIDIMPPIATKITLQPLDTEIYHCDISSAVSKHLSSWQVLSVGTVLSVPCVELGGFIVDIFVKDIEPASTVLLRGDVPLELEESIETVAEWIKKTTSPLVSSQVIPSNQELFPEEIDESSKKVGFVPFSGKGHSLR